MLTPYEQRKLKLELFYMKPRLDMPERIDIQEAAEVAVDNEIESLKRQNEHLRLELAAMETRNDELEKYAHTVAHNLKNPISVIILTSDAISEIGDLTREELIDYMKEIRTTAYSMDDTVDNLLLLSEVRKVDVPFAPVKMGGVVANALHRLSPMIKENQATILTPKSWPPCMGYAPWIEEVWANYISNALKYGGKPPIIRLGASVLPDSAIRFWILDNGPGIPLQAQAGLFNPFNKLDQSHRPGHGLGLSIVRQIMEKMGGKVGVDSKAGKGSLFFFTLPPG